MFKTFCYPIDLPRVQTKRMVRKHFVCCRGGGQTFNAGEADLNCLSAYFLEKSRDYPDRIKDVKARNSQARGWLIFATHDVSDAPTPYGCTPGLFRDIVRSVVDSGARVLPVCDAWRALCSPRM